MSKRSGAQISDTFQPVAKQASLDSDSSSDTPSESESESGYLGRHYSTEDNYYHKNLIYAT